MTLESPLDCKEVQLVHPKRDQFWVFIGRTDAEAETPVLWPPHGKSWLIGKDWCWEGLGAGGEGDDRGWDGWMASPTRWTWVWVNSRSWWWTGRSGVLEFMGSQRVGHDWVTELNWRMIILSEVGALSQSTCSGVDCYSAPSPLQIHMDWCIHSVFTLKREPDLVMSVKHRQCGVNES